MAAVPESGQWKVKTATALLCHDDFSSGVKTLAS